ncbi:MAG: DUF6596 domain-containing protein [Pseudomonadota bacterium]
MSGSARRDRQAGAGGETAGAEGAAGAGSGNGAEGAALAAETAARQSYGRLLAWLAARSRDLAAAEDALAEAFAAALATWPHKGVPRNPEGWLAVAARRQLIGAARHAAVAARAQPVLALLDEERLYGAESMRDDANLPDERLKLMFAVAHPAIDAKMHAPLMLQCVLGFDAAAIARACVVPPATMGQRLSRAKAKIRTARIPFALPDAADLPARLDPVLDAIYAAFGLAWHDPDGRRDLTEEALWLGDLLARRMPHRAEAQGLVALMRFAHARADARRDGAGRFVPLDAQDTALWDAALIARAQADLARAAALRQPGRFQLEAAIQAVHVDRAETGRIDWTALAALYRMLWRLAPTLSTLCGQAAVLIRLGDPGAALARLDTAAGAATGAAAYQPWWAVRAAALRALRRHQEAREAARQAAALAQDRATRDWLYEKAGRDGRDRQ